MNLNQLRIGGMQRRDRETCFGGEVQTIGESRLPTGCKIY